MLSLLSGLGSNPQAVLTVFLALCLAFIVGIAFHEFSHALVANFLGDTTAKNQGRLTLNPIAHLDPLGTLLLLLIGFGWGKPTPVNPNRLRNGPKAGMALVSAAGPISNFLMAALFAAPIRFGLVHLDYPAYVRFWSFENYVAWLFLSVVLINALLGVFNLLPIAPLDGAKIAIAIFPGELGNFFSRMEPYGPGILMVAFMLSYVSPSLSIFNSVIGPIRDRLVSSLLT
jgi:Zn-dependent protease